MNGISNAGKVGIIAIVATALIVLAIVYGTGKNAAQQSSGTQNAALTATSPTETSTTTSSQASANHPAGTTAVRTVKPAAPATIIHIITPVKNDIWKIGTQNLISWDKAGNFSGSISLIDATTKKTVGVILPQVGPLQTSYTWNVRDVFLNRTNPLKSDVLPGTYEIWIAYDGNNIQPFMSPAFTITN